MGPNLIRVTEVGPVVMGRLEGRAERRAVVPV